MKKQMLAVLGSPHKNGSVAKLLHIAAEQARQNGYEVKWVDVYERAFRPCTGCMVCRKTGVCAIDDNIADVREALQESALIVMASPVYFANVPGPLKNLLDRLVGALMDDNSLIPKPMRSPEQRYLLLAACGTPAPFDTLAGQSTGCLRAMDEALHISGMKRAGKAVFAGTKGKTQIPAALEQKIRRLVDGAVIR